MTLHKNPLAAALALALFCLAPLAARSETDAATAVENDADAQANNAGKGDAKAPSELAAITVTARRRGEDAEKIPVAVSAFDADELRDLQAKNIDGLQGAVPNLNIVQGRGSSSAVNVFIRGVGQPDALQSFDPGVGMYVDDVYYSRIQGGLFTLFDVDRIEVLRGPQGTLYGKNSTGGAIKIVTRDPGQSTEGAIEGTVGNYGRFEGRGYVAAPLTETLSMSAAVVATKSDGYVTDPVTNKDYNGDETQAARVKLAWRPSDSFTGIFTIDYTHQDNALTLGNPEAPLIQTDLVRGAVVLRPLPGGKYNYETRTSFDPDQGQRLRHSGASAALTWKLSDPWTLKSITAYRRLNTSAFIDIDASQFELGDVFVGVHQKQFSQELQLQYDNGSNLQAIYGLYYLKEQVPSEQYAFANDFLALAGAPISFVRTVNDDLETRSVAAFAHISWMFAPTWTIAGGLRYTTEDKDYFRTTSTFSSLSALRGTFAFNVDDSWSALTPSLSLQKAFTDHVMGYISANRGFKSGGFNGRANSAAEVSTFDPEYVWTYEAGLKMTSDDHRLLFNVTAFHSDYKDFQARVSEVVNPGAPVPTFAFPVLNAAKLGINGIEFESVMLVGESSKVSGQVGYLDASYDEFNDPRVVVNPALASLHDHVAFSPRWTARIAASHNVYLPGGGVIGFGADVSYRDDTWLSVDNRPGLEQDAFTLVGLYGTYNTADSHWQFRAGVRNLTDKLYKTDAQEFSSVGNIQTAYYGMPRNYYVSVRYDF